MHWLEQSARHRESPGSRGEDTAASHCGEWASRQWPGGLAAGLQSHASGQRAAGIIRRLDPTLVVGLGGFASGGWWQPPGCCIALVIHEQNAVAGLTNRVLARLARRVFAAFPRRSPDVAR
ncbi:hypothetical protein DSL92_03040 [Billgrantia gudaonensis]|uniref:Glycosyltransferase family 28 N-terminal domain-containing protein n=1 Tax=Billgrantia gudaonensis TaxID=376427 RepID=A0A432JLA0_9GAMM|nr:hypothetical protein DSL92_03040 [Halomonas gudaonensis]